MLDAFSDSDIRRTGWDIVQTLLTTSRELVL